MRFHNAAIVLPLIITLVAVVQTRHPGNLFLLGEEVRIALPHQPSSWKLVDYDGKVLEEIPGGAGQGTPGKLPCGFYRYLGADGSWVSLGVLPQRFKAPTDSPIAVDVAMSWFYGADRMADVADLCRLAGVRWVRDRLAWGEVETSKGSFKTSTRYDDSEKAQTAAGLRLLQVNHSTPAWAGNTKRFPDDLRDAYRFYRSMAARWKGKVDAFEPWNEADIDGFGGHIGSEVASMQKASALGLKAGNPGVTACLSVFAGHNRAILSDVASNRTWPYFDTYNFHHYESLDGFDRLYADHRAVSAGRPMWVSECAIPLQWSGDPALKEFDTAALREQSERTAKVYVSALFQGARKVFAFVLPDYSEGQTQFGLIRRDLTPRPAYLAMATCARELGDAKPLGRIRGTGAITAYLFSKPGQKLVVAWSDRPDTLNLPEKPESVVDHIGRTVHATRRIAITSSPLFIQVPSTAMFDVIAPPKAATPLTGNRVPWVLQAHWTREQTDLGSSAYIVSSERPTRVPLSLYNFGSKAGNPVLRVEAPKGWRASVSSAQAVGPMDKADLGLDVRPPQGASLGKVVVLAKIGSDEAVLSLRLMPDGKALAARPGQALVEAQVIDSWTRNVSSGTMSITAVKDGVEIMADTAPGDRWVYPQLKLRSAPPKWAIGLAMKVELLEGDARFRTILDERGEASYIVEMGPPAVLGKVVQTVARLSSATHGDGWSKVDPNGRLDLDQVVTVKVGANLLTPKVRFRITDLRWVGTAT